MKKKTILLDVDEVICFGGFLEAVNEFLGTNYVIDDFTDYYIDEVAIPKERMDEFNEFIRNRDMYKNPQLLPKAIEVIKKLNEEYDIYILSSCVNPFDIEGSGNLFMTKYNFLRNLLPFINPKNFILTSAKHLFKADIQIDDVITNFSDDVNQKILFTSYHNKNITEEELKKAGVIRAGDDWRNAWSYIEKMLLPSYTKEISNDKKIILTK